ncbi:prepilin-type N-terminal cleavage/methylation domain-containing protein [Clostridium sp.]|uniref:pilus assembly FimT family protein n=1 Tax=Clostridium sp. TaxID=1506 RepID=UPI0032173F4A
MRKTKGITLVEVIATLSIFSIVISLIITTYSVWMKNYKADMEYSKGIIDINEALMYIDYHVNYNGQGCFERDDKIIIRIRSKGYKDYEDYEDYISLQGNELMIYYENEDKRGYTPRALLYGVKDFSIIENDKVLFIKITNEDGIKGEKSIGKL